MDKRISRGFGGLLIVFGIVGIALSSVLLGLICLLIGAGIIFQGERM